MSISRDTSLMVVDLSEGDDQVLEPAIEYQLTSLQTRVYTTRTNRRSKR